MKMRRFSIACLCLALSLSHLLNVASAQPDDRALRLYANATTGPIGFITSLGPVTINARRVQGGRPIWNGDQVKADGEENIAILFDSIGRIILKRGSVARFAASTSEFESEGSKRVLIVSLACGEMRAVLDPKTRAHIEAAGSALSASAGARFRIAISDGRVTTEVTNGVLDEYSQHPPQLKARAVQVGSGPVVEIPNVPLKIKAGKTKKLAIQWQRYYRRIVSKNFSLTRVGMWSEQGQSDPSPVKENVVGRTVKLEVVPSNLGDTRDPTTNQKRNLFPTDSRGVVEFSFEASRKSGRGRIIATISDNANDPPGTTYEQFIIEVIVEPVFWTPTRIAIAAGAGVGAVVLIPRKKDPIIKVPPTQTSP